jgi:hypothetical protein
MSQLQIIQNRISWLVENPDGRCQKNELDTLLRKVEFYKLTTTPNFIMSQLVSE